MAFYVFLFSLDVGIKLTYASMQHQFTHVSFGLIFCGQRSGRVFHSFYKSIRKQLWGFLKCIGEFVDDFPR